ncbi:MAG: hypothetical protein J6A56_03925 [Clostridia bacterium]|nr:hypothetical protein [Clostridia bacterium]
MSKTIKELADELGVSKTAIRKYMTEEFRASHATQTDSGVITIDSEGCKLIAESLRKNTGNTGNQLPETSANQVSGEIIAILTEQLRAKDEQIAAQQQQIAQLTAALENTTASLQAAQALHAGTIKQQQLLEDGEAAKKRKWWQFGKRTEG